MRNEKQNIIVNKTIEFSIEILKFGSRLKEDRQYEVAIQLIKSGTSIGANVWEAQNAESKADFIHKMKIAAKEADETEYWLELCKRAKELPNPENLIDKCLSIVKILSKIIASSKRNK